MNTIKVIIEPPVTWGVTIVFLEWENKRKRFSSICWGDKKYKLVTSYIKKRCLDYKTPGTYEVSVHPVFMRVVFDNLPHKRIPSNNRRIDLSSGKVYLTKEDAEILFFESDGPVKSKGGVDDIWITFSLEELVIATPFFSREKIGVAVYRDTVNNVGDWSVSYRLVVAKNGKIGRHESNYVGKVLSVSYNPKKDEVTVITDSLTPPETMSHNIKLNEQPS